MKTALRRDHHKCGLSMMEMMFAMLVLFLVGVFVMDMFVMGSRQLVHSSKNEKLASLLRSKVSEIRLMEFDGLDALGANGNFAAPNNEFIYKIDFENFQAYSPGEVRIVNITVSHPDLGRMNNRLVRSKVPDLDPGQVAFDKFGCASCHSLAAAGYADAPNLIPLDKVGDSGVPRPYQTGSGSFAAYVANSMVNPGDFDPFPDGDPTWAYSSDVMLPFSVEGISPTYDPDIDVSTQEMSALASWIEGLQTP